MKTSDPIAEFEAEAERQGISWRALGKARAAAEHITEGQFYERLLKSNGMVLLRESATPQPQQLLEKVFESLGHSARGARVAAAGRSGLREASAPTKHEDPGTVADAEGKPVFAGGEFPASSYAYVPAANDPESWWGLLSATPGGEPDPEFVRAAVELLDPTNPSPGPNIAADDLPDVLAKVAKAWKAAIPDEELPAILTAEAAAFLRLGVPIKGLSAAARGRQTRRL